MLPLDIASQSSTVGVVKYLAELSPDRLNTCDMNNNYLLHHACRGGNCEVISYLLETPMSSVSERNFDGMLPIHLFCKFANEQEESEDTTDTETIWMASANSIPRDSIELVGMPSRKCTIMRYEDRIVTLQLQGILFIQVKDT